MLVKFFYKNFYMKVIKCTLIIKLNVHFKKKVSGLIRKRLSVCLEKN